MWVSFMAYLLLLGIWHTMYNCEWLCVFTRVIYPKYYKDAANIYNRIRWATMRKRSVYNLVVARPDGHLELYGQLPQMKLHGLDMLQIHTIRVLKVSRSRNQIVEPKKQTNKFVHSFSVRICGTTIWFRDLLTFSYYPLLLIYSFGVYESSFTCKLNHRHCW